jgi:hypothetical protein
MKKGPNKSPEQRRSLSRRVLTHSAGQQNAPPSDMAEL